MKLLLLFLFYGVFGLQSYMLLLPITKKILKSHIAILIGFVSAKFHFECLVDVLLFPYPTSRGSSCFMLEFYCVICWKFALKE